MKMLRLSLPVVLLSLTACAWVKPTPGGQAVAVVKPEHVTTCSRVGQTSARTAATLGFIVRNRNKVAAELQTLARNDAAAMGGDTVVAQGAPVDGAQQFTIYRCR